MPGKRALQLAEYHSTHRPAQPGEEAARHAIEHLDHSLLAGNHSPTKRGSAPAHAASMQRMQQHYGNRAVRRFLQRSAAASTPTPVQRIAGMAWLAAGQVQSVVVGMSLIQEAIRLAEARTTLLPAEDVRAALEAPDRSPELIEALNKGIGKIMGIKEPGAEEAASTGEAVEAEAPQVSEEPNKSEEATLTVEAKKLLLFLEKQFILNPKASSLDLLPPERRDRYRDFAWDLLDFPGNKKGEAKGPNERRAGQMADDLSAIRPERRVNFTDDAVVTEKEHTQKMQKYILDELEPIPGQKGKKLNRLALESFVTMEAAAAADGVTLKVLSSYRSPETSKRRAAAADNKAAVADFSAHNLGLAIDLKMSAGKQRYKETSTKPMQTVVNMRESPVHKWMFMRGAAYGWFPYQNEPWHFEYNPTGMRERFRANMEEEE